MEFSEETRKRIEKQIASGRYKTAEEVIEEALSVLEEEEAYLPDLDFKEFEQSLIDAMKEPAVPFTKEYWESVKTEARRQAAEQVQQQNAIG